MLHGWSRRSEFLINQSNWQIHLHLFHATASALDSARRIGRCLVRFSGWYRFRWNDGDKGLPCATRKRYTTAEIRWKIGEYTWFYHHLAYFCLSLTTIAKHWFERVKDEVVIGMPRFVPVNWVRIFATVTCIIQYGHYLYTWNSPNSSL